MLITNLVNTLFFMSLFITTLSLAIPIQVQGQPSGNMTTSESQLNSPYMPEYECHDPNLTFGPQADEAPPCNNNHSTNTTSAKCIGTIDDSPNCRLNNACVGGSDEPLDCKEVPFIPSSAN